MGRPVFKAPPRSRSENVLNPPKRVRTMSSPVIAQPDDPTVIKADTLNDSMLVSRHPPRSYAELALHKNKLEEIIHALDPESRTRVVVISGPSGSSKSSAVRLICKEQNKELLEFLAPETNIGSTGIMGSFREFLVGASMYERRSSVVFVDEMPNLFHEDTRRLFEEALIDWAIERMPQPILVVAFTEIEVSAHYTEAAVVPRVLGSLVALKEHCCWIKTNAVNATLISKALKLVLAREHRTCAPAILKEISQCGDIRNAINALDLCLKSSELSDARSLVRGFPVQLFHAIGKIIWGTSKEGSLEKAIDTFSDTLDTFNLTILDNYCSAYHSRLALSAAVTVSDCLSEADLCLPYLGSVAAAHAIQSSDPDTHAVKRFESLKFTQYPKWKRLEHESRAKLITRVKERRLYEGPMSVTSAVMDEVGYEPQLQNPDDLVPDISSNDDDDDF